MAPSGTPARGESGGGEVGRSERSGAEDGEEAAMGWWRCDDVPKFLSAAFFAAVSAGVGR